MLIWGAWFVLTRASVTHALRAEDIAALRFGVGALVLLPGLLRSRPKLTPRAWREGAILSVFWGAPFVLLLSWALRTAPAGLAASLTPGAMPVIAGFLSWTLFGERPGWQRTAGFVAIGAGVLWLASGSLLSGDPQAWRADALLLCASALWACYTLRIRRSGLTAVQAAGLICILSSLVVLPPYVLLGLSRMGQASWTEILLQAAYQGVLVSGVSLIAFNRAVGLLGPGRAGAMASLVPVVATLLAIPVLGEVPTLPTALATGSIALGVFLVGTARQALRVPV